MYVRYGCDTEYLIESRTKIRIRCCCALSVVRNNASKRLSSIAVAVVATCTIYLQIRLLLRLLGAVLGTFIYTRIHCCMPIAEVLRSLISTSRLNFHTYAHSRSAELLVSVFHAAPLAGSMSLT